MIQYARLNKKKNCLAYLFFVLFNLEILVQFNFGQNSRTRTTPIAGHLTVVYACSGGHLTNYFFKSQIPRGLPGGGLIAVGFDSYITVGGEICTMMRKKCYFKSFLIGTHILSRTFLIHFLFIYTMYLT